VDLPTVTEALFACFLIGALSLKMRFIDVSGAVAAFIIGFLIFVLPPEGWRWFIVILIFHAVAAQFTKYKYEHKRRIGFAQEKGGARAWPNITANGGIAALFAFGEGLWPSGALALGFIGAVSTATADTLATEIGLLSRVEPRLITSLRRKVPAGTSGGVSLMGELATLFGAIVIGFAAWLLNMANLRGYGLEATILVAVISGFVGCTFDSVLGASVQGMFRCKVCGSVTENKKHCHSSTVHLRGSRMIDNNMVNLIATAVGALAAVAAFILI